MTTNAILSEQETIESTMKSSPTKPNDGKLGETTLNGGKPNGGKLSEANCWHAVVKRDRSLDGMFVFAVSSTGVFCRPSCPARRPQRQNVQFFEHATAAEQAGYRACLRCRPKAVDGNPQSALVRAMCRYIEQNIEDRLTLGVLATKFRRSAFHLQRMFKSVLGVSPKAYIDACRFRQVKQNLQAGHDVTTSLYAAGYGSSSRLYERTASQLGMTPEKYRRGAMAAVVRFTIAPSPLGRMLIAATDKGICAIQFAGSDEELQQGLMREFPFASRKRDDAALAEWRVSLEQLLNGQQPYPSLPLDIRATAFQRRVWEHLQRIPRGETQSYSAVAKKLGMPKATRAVARACATNPVAIAIPCHRVVREDGDLGGYRWGIDRKEQLLEMEKGAGA
jgi:AraC family transcriptional regulator, regulatory protein of adaptative response / methylated-DNA-[protein]-cysteine methyltransferase